MLNQAVLVGRITGEPEVKETESGKKVTNLTLAVPRSYKNENGEYDTDFINCSLWNSIAENVCQYCHKGDLVGIKGRIQTDTYEKDGEKKFAMQLVAEKVTFLSSKATEKEDEEEKDSSKDEIEM